MKIAIVSNSDSFFPLVYALSGQHVPVGLFYSPNADSFINQKVIAFAKQAGISFSQEQDPARDLYNWLLQGQYDVCFILGYKYLIDLTRLKTCKTRLFNIHFGPLPAYRGATPVFWQLKRGEHKLGLCIHHISQKFDDGAVIWLKETDNLPHYNYQSVNQLFNQLCIEGVFYVLQLFINQLSVPVIDRSAFKPAYQKKPGFNEVMINWQQMRAIEIGNLIRACNPWNKGAITFFKGHEIKLMDMRIIPQKSTELFLIEPGTIVYDEGQLWVGCLDCEIIAINTLVYNDFFMPAYLCKNWGFLKGQKFS